MEFSGTVHNSKRNAFAVIFWPIAQIKLLFQVIYQYILHIIWSELVMGKKIENELISLVLFVSFSILSLLIYHLQQYSKILLIVLLIIWYIDRSVAQAQYFNPQHQLKVRLVSNSDQGLRWEMNLPDRKKTEIKINYEQLEQILISCHQMKAGAFEEVIGLVWQVELITTVREHFLLDEKPDILTAFQSAQILAHELNLPILFKDSEGNNQYAENLLDLEEFTARYLWPKTVLLKRNSKKYHLASQWRLGDSWQLLREIFEKSGFLLFLLIMTSFMAFFGELVNSFISGYLGIEFDGYSGSYPMELFNFSTIASFIIAILLMIFQGWQISRKKHIYLDKYYLKFYLDHQKLGQLKIAEIKACLLITAPEYNLFIITDHDYLRIGKLHREEDFRAMLVGIDQGLSEFKEKTDH
jgi:hypothetical protein